MADLRIIKRNGGLGRREPVLDMVSGLIQHGLAVSGKIALNEVHRLNSLPDALNLGLDAAYDAANSVLVHYHIKEFFRRNPNGELWIVLVDQSVTQWDLLVDPTQTSYAKKLLIEAGGRVRQLGVAFNPDGSYTATLAGGLDDQIQDVITQAQLLAEDEFNLGRPLEIIIEGKSFNGTAGSADDLRARNSPAPDVSVVIAADLDISALDPLYAGHAALGTVLGDISAASVHENIGWVEKFRVDTNGIYTRPGLSSNLSVNSYTPSALEVLKDKGYILAKPYNSYPGVYWNDSPTCCPASSDFAFIENNRTIKKAARLVRTKLMPRVSSPVKVSEEGKLDKIVIDSFEAAGREALDPMARANEISVPADVYVDPDQDVLSTSKLEVRFSLIPMGVARTIEASIGFANPF